MGEETQQLNIQWRGNHSNGSAVHSNVPVRVHNLVLQSGRAERELHRLARRVAHAIDQNRDRALRWGIGVESFSLEAADRTRIGDIICRTHGGGS